MDRAAVRVQFHAMNALEKLRSIVIDIQSRENPMQMLDQWTLAGRLLSRMPTDQAEVTRVVKERDLEALDALVAAIENPAPPTKPDTPEVEVTHAEMDAALRAFKKRLKLTRLSDESKLGGHYTTSGRESQIDAIVAPAEFEPAVWKALERAGKLKDAGQGFYALP